MNATIAYALKFVTSRLAGWLTPIIATAITWVIVQATTHAPWIAEPLSTVDQVAVTATIVAFIMAAVNALTNKYLTQGTKEVQDTLNTAIAAVLPNAQPISTDGVAGPNTLGKAGEVLNSLIKLAGVMKN
jgi:hypothetical protein